jgi:hypothetical protein
MARKTVVANPVTISECHAACRLLTNLASEPNAKAYCGAVAKHNMSGEYLHSQIPYILTNGSSLRGTGAKEAKEILKLWYKQHTKNHFYID